MVTDLKPPRETANKIGRQQLRLSLMLRRKSAIVGAERNALEVLPNPYQTFSTALLMKT